MTKLADAPYIERGSIVTATIQCPPKSNDGAADRAALEAARREVAANWSLAINGVRAGRFHSVDDQGGLRFIVADTSGDAAEAKALTAFWTAAAQLEQPVKATLSLTRDSGGPIATATSVLYATPMVVATVCPERVCVLSKGDSFELKIANMAKLREAVKNGKLLLFLNGKPVGVESKVAGPEPALTFELTTHSADETERAALLGGWRWLMAQRGYDAKSYKVSIGTATQTVATSRVEVRIHRVDGGRLALWLIFAGLVIGGIVYLGIKSELLRESCPPPPDGKRRAYSLARVQMAWWFAITLIAFCMYWVVLGEGLTLPANMLALMGISGATTALAYTVDSGNHATDKSCATTGNILEDLLTSKNGVELPRFQMLVWTIVFGFMILGEFLSTLTLPNPDPTWLGLMGLSSGLYVGFKIPEVKT